MHPPCLSPIAYLLRKRLPLYAGQWRIHEGAIGIENVARFVRREFPHAAAWDIEASLMRAPLVSSGAIAAPSAKPRVSDYETPEQYFSFNISLQRRLQFKP